MEHMTTIRLLAHYLIITWIVAMILAATQARGKRITVTHVPIAVTGLALAGLWFIGLALTVKGSEVIPRGAILPLLAGLELGAGVCAWGWLALCGHYNFHFRLHGRRPSTLTVIVVLMAAFALLGCTVDLHVETQPAATPRPVIATFITPTPRAPVSPLAAPESPLALPLELTPDVRPYTDALPLPGTTVGNTPGD